MSSTTVRQLQLDELPGLEGEKLGTSEWHEITQSQVQMFADATGDQQWIHVDPERAKSGPFGGPGGSRLPDPVPRAGAAGRDLRRRRMAAPS